MTRELTVENAITLPRLDATSAVALGQEILLTGKQIKTLPKFISNTFARLETDHQALQKAMQASLGAGNSINTNQAREADRAEDNAVAALFDFLAAWARLPETLTESSDANHLIRVLFPQGLKFLNLSYKLEWAEVEARLARIKQDKLDEIIKQLGGAPFLKHLQTVHATYGQVLGMTSLKANEEDLTTTAVVREPFQRFLATLRSYVLKVLAYQDETQPDTFELSEQLLRPINEWQSRPTRKTISKSNEPTVM